jgi:hypothetical protein
MKKVKFCLWYFVTLFWYPSWKKRLHDDPFSKNAAR